MINLACLIHTVVVCIVVIGLLDIVKHCTYIGMADDRLALLQYNTRLYLMNVVNIRWVGQPIVVDVLGFLFSKHMSVPNNFLQN